MAKRMGGRVEDQVELISDVWVGISYQRIVDKDVAFDLQLFIPPVPLLPNPQRRPS